LSAARTFDRRPLRARTDVIERDHLRTRDLDEFVGSLAHRIARFPAGARRALKERVNAISLASTEEFRRDSDAFGQRLRSPSRQISHYGSFARSCNDATIGGVAAGRLFFENSRPKHQR
jgi:hypothetical protein